MKQRLNIMLYRNSMLQTKTGIEIERIRFADEVESTSKRYKENLLLNRKMMEIHKQIEVYSS
ncbi:MAG: hypothetical protein ABI851_14955 [Saprospiraceae bacterium]